MDPFDRLDPSDDAEFYRQERKVVHLEPGAIEALRGLYAEVLPPGGAVLDLMSSWRSHLPSGLGHVTGLGMNEAEMADNDALDGHTVHDLNRSPLLPFPDEVFDAAVCAVSVQYLLHPVLVFTEVLRVLRPGGPFVVSFSNRCFPTKAVAVWLYGDDEQHQRLVETYFERAGYVDIVSEQVPTPDDPLFVVRGVRPRTPQSPSQ